MIPYQLWGDALSCEQEVVGVPRHEAAIRALFPGKLPASGADLHAVADLVPRPDNRFDPYAIEVRVSGFVVGYLPRDEARRYHHVLSELVAQDLQPQVPCQVRASEWTPSGWQHTDDSRTGFHASVAITLAQPHLVTPANLPPPATHHLLPAGDAGAVAGTDARVDAVAPFLRPEGECWAYATLHAIEEVTARDERLLVEIRLDDEPVGRLGPRLSSGYLPAVQYLADMRAETAARVVVRGDALKAEVELYAARSLELPVGWPDGLERSPVAVVGWCDGAAATAVVPLPTRQHRATSPVSGVSRPVSQSVSPINW